MAAGTLTNLNDAVSSGAMASALFSLAGTYAGGPVAFEASVDNGVTYPFALSVNPAAGGSAVTALTLTANQAWAGFANSEGFSHVRVRATGAVGGATATVVPTMTPLGGGGGGGGGSVTLASQLDTTNDRVGAQGYDGANLYTPGSFVLTLPTTISANGTGAVLAGLGLYHNALVDLNLSAVPAGGTPTLDVYLQTSADGGTTWRDVAHTQFAAAALHRFFQFSDEAGASTSVLAASDAALAGETVAQGPWGDMLRLKWVFAAGASTGAYTLAARVALR
jgi:hypothetical protein